MRQPPPGKAGIWRADDPPRALERYVHLWSYIASMFPAAHVHFPIYEEHYFPIYSPYIKWDYIETMHYIGKISLYCLFPQY